MARFCAGLRQLQQSSGLDRAALARRVNYSRSQLYLILDGGIRRPPEWDRLVEPLVRACTGNDERAVADWRRRHSVLVEVYQELKHKDQRDTALRLTGPVPAQLPADVDVFTGRTAELAELDRYLPSTPEYPSAVGAGSTAVVISAVSGTAGVGKTALALRWAHRVRAKFSDGQLYVNLRGYDPDRPLSAADVLAGFLRALGVAGPDIPPEVDERAASYRSLLDGRRILIVLDNASSVEQVRPLLPGTPSALVMVTSRDSLAGLVARHGARRLDLDLLPPEDAVALLRALIGERVAAEPDEAAMLAGQCARLPLALRVAAELAAARPTTSLTHLVEELADQQRRLDLLDAGGDPRTAVRAVFSWSYQNLPDEAARAFRLLGLHPGPDLDPYAAAALTHVSVEQAQHLLDLLARTHLIGPTDHDRYGMHDLLRAYATDLAAGEDSEQERRAALTRLFDHYLATTAAAMDTYVPSEQHRRPRVPPSATPTPSMADLTAARPWLDAERSTLVAVCVYTATHGWPGHAIRLATTLLRYLDLGGHYSDALVTHTHALFAARLTGDFAAEAHARSNLGLVHCQLGRYELAADYYQVALTLSRELDDREGEARTLTNLGLIYWRQGRYVPAAEDFQQALTLCQELGDRSGEARALGNLGNVCWRQGRYQQAGDHGQHALALFRDLGDREGEARALGNLGLVHRRQGCCELAADYHQQALILSREIGDRESEADELGNLGTVYRQQGRYELAADYHQQALTLFRELGHRAGEADALGNLGLVSLRRRRTRQAADYHQQALTLFRELGDRAGETEALNGVGETHHATGHHDQAHAHHNAALTLATEISDRYEQARAHNGLAHTHHATGELDQARHHWQHALALYTALGVPDADDVHAHLATVDQSADGSNGE